MTSWKLNLCKLHNEVFKAAESRINTECLPLVGGDVSAKDSHDVFRVKFAPRRRGCFGGFLDYCRRLSVCPS